MFKVSDYDEEKLNEREERGNRVHVSWWDTISSHLHFPDDGSKFDALEPEALTRIPNFYSNLSLNAIVSPLGTMIFRSPDS